MEGKKKPGSRNSQQAPQRKKGDNKNNEFQWKRAGKTSLIWVMILMAVSYTHLTLPTNREV